LPRSAVLSIACALLAASIPAAAQPRVTAADGDALAVQALARGLDRAAQWLALGHYEKRLPGLGFASAVRTPEFFLDARGAADPRAELLATLAALLEPGARVRGGEPTACAFPARARWLAEALDLPPEHFVREPCDALDRWLADLRPRAMTLVFPEAFMNSPASMFGHTLLRIDVNEAEAPENLLAYAIDFTADTGGETGPLYLLKGATGSYAGRFGLNPYYQKLKLYADWQNRDIWEYRLTLTPEELELVLLHLWEMRDVDFAYFFFDDNCSYQLLRLLEVARPGIDLHSGFPLAVIPVDTVRAVVTEAGLSERVRYRPSPARELRAALGELSPASQRLALALARGDAPPDDERLTRLGVEERAAVLDAAQAALRYAFVSDEVDEEASRSRSYRLLRARSRAHPESGVAPPAAPVPTPTIRPEAGHGTALAAIAAGWRDDESYVELRVRPALHDRLERSGGFAEDSSIRVLDTRVRYFPRLERVRLEELVLLELRSESPRDRFFKPISWHVDTGLRTRLFPESDGGLDPEPVWRSEGGLGVAYAIAGPLKIYGFADARVELGPALEDHFALGPGASAGFELGTPGDRWKGHLFGRVTRFVAGDVATDASFGVDQRITLSRRAALRADVAVHRYAGEAWLDAQVALQWTF